MAVWTVPLTWLANLRPNEDRLNAISQNLRYLKGDQPVEIDDELRAAGPVVVGSYTTAERNALIWRPTMARSSTTPRPTSTNSDRTAHG